MDHRSPSTIIHLTRMHSSRMRTVRSSISGGVCTWSGGIPGPGVGGWGVPARGVHLVRGVCLVGGVPGWGVYLPEGVPGPGGAPGLGGVPAGGCAPGPGGVPGPGGHLVRGGTCPGVYLVPGGCTWSGTPPLRGQTHACKNITFATSLRTVTRMHSNRMRTLRCSGRLSWHAHTGHARPPPCMPPLPCTPPAMHDPPPPATHTPCHACPPTFAGAKYFSFALLGLHFLFIRL